MATKAEEIARISREPVGKDGKVRYVPIIKNTGFNPCPIAGKIPIYADSLINPKCKGTRLYEEFWDEQIDHCRNGYKTGGIWFPGRYYYFLNFMVLSGLLGTMYPFFVDLDLEYYRLLEYVEQRHKTGIVTLKARRKGLSEEAKTVLSHGLRFIPDYRGGVAAGQEVWMTGLRGKFDSGETRIRSEFRLNVLKNNEKKYEVGYEVRDAIGGFRDEGYGGQLFFETMYDKATKLEGEYFHHVICEESGEFEKVSEVISSIQPAMEFGSIMNGFFIVQGTGGNILTTSKGFKEIWDNAETLGFERFWVPGRRKYFPFLVNKIQQSFVDEDTGEEIDGIPNLRKFEDFTPEKYEGCEDVEAAHDYIVKKKVAYSRMTNKKKLKKHNQSFPETVEEAFTSGGNNNFNDELIIKQLMEIEGDLIIKPYIFEWVMDVSEGVPKIKTPLEVKIRPAKPNDKEENTVWVYQLPRTDIRDLDVGGIDSYNQDETQTTKSLGAMVVLRNGRQAYMESEGIHNAEYPVALYYNRPKRKEMFYDICLKMAVAYGLNRNVMASAEQDFVIEYFIRRGGKIFLSPRPKSFDAPGSQQLHKLGAKFTSYSKPMVLGLVQSMVEDYCDYNFFPAILRDELSYDEELIGTDWDSVDALAYAKMRLIDMKTKPRKDKDRSDQYKYGDVQWINDGRGNMVPVEIPPDEEEIEMKEKKKRKIIEGYLGWSALDGIRDPGKEKISYDDDMQESVIVHRERDEPFD